MNYPRAWIEAEIDRRWREGEVYALPFFSTCSEISRIVIEIIRIIRMRSRKPLPDIVQGPRILIFVKFYCVRVWKKNTLRLSSSFVSYNNGPDRRVTRCVKRTCLKVPLRRPMNGRRYRIQRTPTFRFEWKGPAMCIVRYEVRRENVPRDVASPNRTYRGDDFVSSTTVLLLLFLTNRCQRTEGNFIYSRGEKSYLLSIVLRSTSRLE